MEKKVKVSILPQINTDMPEELEIEMDQEKSTIPAILSKFCELLGLQPQRYDELLKRPVSVFWTRTLVKNGKVIGRFSMDGRLDVKEKKDLEIKAGDELVLFGPAEGG